MSEQIMEILEPVFQAFLIALIGIIITAIYAGRDLVTNWIRSKTNANQQAVIDKVAAEAYAYAEKWAKNKGMDKLNAAAVYVADELKERGINISNDKIMAAVQAAWEQYGNRNK